MLLTYLRLRTWLGWGWHPDDLRVRARLYVSAASRLLPLAVIFSLILSGFVALLEPSSRHARALPDLIHSTVVVGALFVLLIVAGLLVPALSSRILARRAHRERPAVVSGRCFASIPDSPLYACIGPNRESARWYVLPLDWDTAIEPSPTELELTVIEGCGCVERLRRLGPNPRDLRVSDLEAQENAGISPAEARQAAQDAVIAAASPQERVALRRFAWQAGIAARFPPSTILICAWLVLILGGLCSFGLVMFLAIPVVLSPERFRDPGGRVAGLVLLALPLIVGIACVVYGICQLRAGRRARATRHEPPAAVTGEVVSWAPYNGLCTSRDPHTRTETLIRIRLPDGTTPIFCIPKVYLHRVRELGAPVRVTYLPSTWRVVAVRRLEQPGEASPAD